jgi:Ca2+-binding RTX toxin-like protein
MAVTYIRSDLEFILQQILISEAHAAGTDLTSLIPNAFVPWGLRTVDGSFNNLAFGNEDFGSSDELFPRLLDPVYADDQDGDTFAGITNTDYGESGDVVDADPRIISNLIADLTSSNPAAVALAGSAGIDGIWGTVDDVLNDGVTILRTRAGFDGVLGTTDDIADFSFDNVAPDEGLSAPFNQWFVFFGQFFDHGLDLVQKGGNGFVFIPLQADDPLVTLGPDGAAGTGDELAPGAQFMVLSRATTYAGPGADGILGDDPTTLDVDESADDTIEHLNQTSPFVDQNQTYSSHPSHQVFLRAYEMRDGAPVSTGKLLTNRDLGADGTFGTADDTDLGGMSTWAALKAQARDLLGINLTDADVGNVPLLATDAYGNFIRGPNGFPQVVMMGPDGLPGTADDFLMEGNPAAPIDLTNAVRTGQMFLADIAHSANPFDSLSGALLTPDADTTIGDDGDPATYDNELLDQHFMAGDGRVNENVGLTAVHHVFHSEHNRLVEHTKQVALATGDVAFLNQWLDPDAQLTIFPVSQAEIDALQWNGERLFQAAKFGTEMQYQHLVFEEFARKIQPNIDEFLAPEGFSTQLNPAIVAEFAHVVYRFGHSMLLDEIDRLDPNFASSEIGLIEAFLNPLAFNEDGTLTAEEAAGAIVRGTTRQVGNEIDEFKTEALRNNLLGLPLDLASINLARARDTGVPSLNAARRELYALTVDAQLKPYESWIDFMQGVEHPESLVNFIAAYGTHGELVATDVDTLAEKRAVATALVFGGSAVINAGTEAERTFTADDTDRLDFLYGTGIYANINGLTVTGVDDIDFWIGGLAERISPFGGMLGSTFNFVFETQLEALQNGDRLYYLSRLAGLNFLTELENNTFAALIMANTDATHLPADVFSTPAFTLEVDPSRQFTGLGAEGRDDPVDNSNPLEPLVIRDNPATQGLDTNYLEYTGGDHVVLGGTDSDDILIASIGDDTLWGDGGNDRIEGGYGNDQIDGGAGDDIITDVGGDDVIKGNEGHDVIQGGNGLNILIGGFGNDFIITGEDISTTFGGPGNDFILGAPLNLPTLGNEGDDWIEIGTSDGAGGDNFDPQEASPVIGHDVFITGTGFDEVDGEGGDDIMVGSDGPDHFGGGGGFDWASYENEALFGVKVDLDVNDFVEPPVPASVQGTQDRFADVEGLSGTAFSDILRGTEATAADIDIAGALNSALTDPSRIDGLQEVLDRLLGSGTTRFASGNIILGGSGSDILEGRGGDDLIDGDSWLNVRVSVRAIVGTDEDGNLILGDEIRSVESIADLVPDMMSGAINPGQLVIVREILSGTPDFDTAFFAGSRAEYDVIVDDGADGVFGTADDLVTVVDLVPNRDGVDRLINVERLQFSDVAETLVFFDQNGNLLNNDPIGQPTIDDDTPEVGQVLTASVADVIDLDNPELTLSGPVAFYWQVERDPAGAPGVFEDIVDAAGGAPGSAEGARLTVTADLAGLALRVKAIYQDANGTLETVFSAPTAAVAAGTPPAAAPVLPDGSNVASAGIHLITADLQFILDQIKIAEQHTAGADLLDLIANARLPFGLRTVDGSLNNLVQGQDEFGGSDNTFPRLLDPFFRNDQDGDAIALGPPPAPVITNTDYGLPGNVVDADPRIISNLIADQTSNNPAAVAVAGSAGADGIWGTADDALNDGVTIIGRKAGADLALNTADDIVFFSFENVAPDEGLSAPFNLWFVFFGQFFDHGLDLVEKGGNGTVFIPLQPDDPLIAGADGAFGTADDLPPELQFMVLTRATPVVGPGADGVLGTDDDTVDHTNLTTPFVDQNQTYTSTPSHQVFLREYQLSADGRPVATGRLITNHEINPDGTLGADLGGMSTWGTVKAQARELLGIQLSDYDAVNVPLVKVDLYGNFIPGANGFAQLIIGLGADGIAQTDDDIVIEGDPAANGGLGVAVPVDAPRTGHPFLADIANSANPFSSQTGLALAPDSDSAIGLSEPGTYDDELLAEHFMAGDGRANENIGLTAVHHVFHSEHNRLVGHIKDVVLASAAEGDVSFLNEWLLAPVAAVPADLSTLVWNGERLFQAARFGTEMQYQHLVFEEFARLIQPQIDIFLQEGQGYDTTIDPSIVAEFAHVVYRFGHSTLLDEIDRFSPEFASSQIGLIEAFLNPTAFDLNGTLTAEEAAGAIVRGTTRQAGNAIDEFKTEALRNNLLGLPLDLAAINLTRARETGIPTLNAARATFFEWTGDSQLTPYASWIDFMQNLRHPESLVNFIAAYGTHSLITSQTTLEGMRAAAFAIVMGQSVTLSNGTVIDVPADRLDFLYSTGTWANDSGRALDLDGVTTTGLGNVDFWIGGLAEENMPFGGMLGSTFNYVFENQLEKLQNGDRFYYLERVSAQNFLTELEGNSFAKLIMANTDATHLPGNVFTTPTFVLEVDQTKQYNEGTGVLLAGPDGILGTADDVEDTNADPVGDDPNPLEPLVIRDNPATAGLDTNYLEYTGADHVVLGGTAGNDTLISSIGDDTLWGDAGHDRLEGGDGVDFLFGGTGDDILTDLSGEDNLQGGDGNDAINSGAGIDLIIAGFGNDFVVTGEDGDETFAGPGNDFILGDPADEMVFGNEGDDWIEGGMADGSAGENFDARGLDAIAGNDVFIDSSFPDRMNGEGGDDIMVGSMGGQTDRFIGGSGFDWASFQGDEFAADIDLRLRAFDETPVPFSAASALQRFESTEGLSGSGRSDILRGDDEDITTIPFSGTQGSTLSNFALINGLQELVDGLLGPGQTSFAAGNIILGGAGSDIIEGRGGDDLIDGDHWLSVRISVRATVDADGDGVADRDADGNLILGDEIDSVTSMTQLVDRVFSGEINPGQLVIAREILDDGDAFSFDTAQFSGALIGAGADGVLGTADDVQQFSFAVNGVATTLADLIANGIADGDVLTVTNLIDDDGDGVAETLGLEGSDTLRHIERLQFSDATIVLRQGLNAEPVGQLTILDATGQPVGTPVEGETLSVSIASVTDADNVSSGGAVTGPVSYVWQFDPRGDGVFEDIVIATGLGDVRAAGTTFTVTNDVAGTAIRVRALYEDEHGVLETVFSAPTALVQGVNQAPTGVPTISDATPTEGIAITALTATIVDPDGTDDATGGGLFTFRWQQSADGGLTWVDATNPDSPLGPDDGTGQIFVPGAGQIGLLLRVVVTFTDDGGTVETVTSAPTQPVLDDGIFIGTAADDILIGDARPNQLFGLEGNDQLFGLAGADILSGGLGDDLLDGGLGADIMDDSDGGNDTYVVDNIGDQVFELGFDGGIDTILTTLDSYALGLGEFDLGHVENLTYTGTGSFTGIGNDLDNVMTGGAGDDTLDGGAGNDTLVGGAGADILTGGTGDDTYIVDSLGDLVSELVGEGTDTIETALNAYTLGDDVENLTFAGAGDFEGTGNALANVITGGAGNDTLDGLAGADTLIGGAGDDTYIVDSSDDAASEDAGGGTDIVRSLANAYVLGANVENLTFIGAGNFTGTGNDLANIIIGSIGDDTLDGAAGVDALFGGGGDDTYIVDSSDDLVIEDADAGPDIVLSLANAYALGANVENLTFIGTGGFTGTGNDLANVITGGAGSDTLDGLAGADTLIGGAGDDIYIVADAGDQVVEGAGAGTDTVRTLLNAYTLGANVENLIFIGTGNFTGTGNALENAITGGSGADTLNGGAGNDTLTGGAGSDNVNGGIGDDVIVATVGDGNDTYSGGTGIDTYDLSATTAGAFISATQASSSQIGLDTLAGIESFIGSQAGDTILLGTGNNFLDGQGGNDTIMGGAGNDTILGGAGIDTLFGDAGNDTIDGGADNDTIFGADGSDTILGGDGADFIDAGIGLDSIVGGAGNDQISAGAGADIIEGGAGNDTMDGGLGNDIFVFASGFGNDTISGFDANPGGGQDLLDLSELGINTETFAESVVIATLGGNTTITIGADTITLFGVGLGQNVITQQDFILA